jgi:hypothetical protein
MTSIDFSANFMYLFLSGAISYEIRRFNVSTLTSILN